jgi:hypothetical protein
MKRFIAAASIGLLASAGLAGLASSVSAAGPTVVASPNPATETTTGVVSFAMLGSNLPPGMFLTEVSPSINIACTGNNLSGTVVHVDFNGRYNDFDTATGCSPGSYVINVSENAAPFQSFTTTLTIKPPATGVKSIAAVPASVHESDTGFVSFNVLGSGLPVGSHYKLSSPGLTAACASNNVTPSAPRLVDFTGRFNFSAHASGCAAGKYVITGTQVGAPHHVINTAITILAP